MGTRAIFASNLARLRDLRGLTQSSLSACKGVDKDPKTIYFYESQDRFPSPETIDSLCEALGVSPAALLTDGDYRVETTPEEALEILSNYVAEKLAEKSPIPARYIERLQRIDPAALDKLFEDAVPAYESDDALRHPGQDPEKKL